MVGGLWTIKRVADFCQVTPKTIRAKIKSGELPALRVGRSVRITTEDVERLLRPYHRKKKVETR